MNRKFLIILIISVLSHLLLLGIRLQQNGSYLVDARNFVGLVSGDQENFTPLNRKKNNKIKANQAKVDSRLHPVQNLSQLKNLKTQPRATLPQLPGSPLHEKPAPLASDLEPKQEDSAVSAEKVTLVAAVVSSSLPSVNGDNPPVDNTRQGLAKRESRPGGIVGQVAALVDAVPRYTDNPSPEYPEVARRKGWTGEVRLLVRVDKAGDVDQISVSRSSGYSTLDRAARRAVRLWRFIPATEAGRKVASAVVVPIRFRMPTTAADYVSVQE